MQAPSWLNKVVIFVVVILILASLVVVVGGKAEEAVSEFDAIAKLFGLGCVDMGPVEYITFIDTIDKVYEACEYRDECKSESCKKMTVQIPAPDTCYIVNKDVLLGEGLEQFVDFFGFTIIKCCKKHKNAVPELNVYNPPSCTVAEPEKCAYKDFFAISNNAEITLIAEKHKFRFIKENTDLIIKIKGGEDYSNCVVVIPGVSCNVYTPCAYVTDNKWCDAGYLNPNYYCAKCTDKDADCSEEPTVTCSTTTQSCNPYDITCAGLSIKARIDHLEKPGNPQFADIYAYTSADDLIYQGASPDIYLHPNEEICLENNGHAVSSSSPDCKLRIYLKEINTGVDPFEVKIIKGCY